MKLDRFYQAFATGFYSGKIPFASGTFGSLFALLIWVIGNYFAFALCLNIGGGSWYKLSILVIWLLIIFATFFIGIKSSSYYCRKHRKDDPSEIVIDEFCGQWIALLICCLASGTFGNRMIGMNRSYLIALASSFILFRIFDIFKPLIIGKVDKNVRGGLGIMLDDVLAGIFAGVAFVILKISIHFLY